MQSYAKRHDECKEMGRNAKGCKDVSQFKMARETRRFPLKNMFLKFV